MEQEQEQEEAVAPGGATSEPEPDAWIWNRHRKKVASWHRKSSACLRYGPVRVVFVVLGWILACGVGALLWKDALKFMENELLLKCQNRKEVSSSNFPSSSGVLVLVLFSSISAPRVRLPNFLLGSRGI